MALARGIETPNTLARIDRLASLEVLNPGDANAWKEAYSLIQLIRMRNHQDQLSRHQSLTNMIEPDSLSALDRRILRESLRQAQRLQQKLENTYGV